MSNQIPASSVPWRIAVFAFALSLTAFNQPARVLAGSQTVGHTTADIPPKELAAQCPLIVYARIQTNSAPRLLLSIAEVWKGSQEAIAMGITNGTRLPTQEWPVDGGPLPDGAVVFIEPNSQSAPEGFRVKSVWFTWPAGGGRTAHMLKAACGLDAAADSSP